jgi:hypothetical protein
MSRYKAICVAEEKRQESDYYTAELYQFTLREKSDYIYRLELLEYFKIVYWSAVLSKVLRKTSYCLLLSALIMLANSVFKF